MTNKRQLYYPFSAVGCVLIGTASAEKKQHSLLKASGAGRASSNNLMGQQTRSRRVHDQQQQRNGKRTSRHSTYNQQPSSGTHLFRGAEFLQQRDMSPSASSSASSRVSSLDSSHGSGERGTLSPPRNGVDRCSCDVCFMGDERASLYPQLAQNSQQAVEVSDPAAVLSHPEVTEVSVPGLPATGNNASLARQAQCSGVVRDTRSEYRGRHSGNGAGENVSSVHEEAQQIDLEASSGREENGNQDKRSKEVFTRTVRIGSSTVAFDGDEKEERFQKKYEHEPMQRPLNLELTAVSVEQYPNPETTIDHDVGATKSTNPEWEGVVQVDTSRSHGYLGGAASEETEGLLLGVISCGLGSATEDGCWSLGRAYPRHHVCFRGAAASDRCLTLSIVKWCSAVNAYFVPPRTRAAVATQDIGYDYVVVVVSSKVDCGRVVVVFQVRHSSLEQMGENKYGFGESFYGNVCRLLKRFVSSEKSGFEKCEHIDLLLSKQNITECDGNEDDADEFLILASLAASSQALSPMASESCCRYEPRFVLKQECSQRAEQKLSPWSAAVRRRRIERSSGSNSPFVRYDMKFVRRALEEAALRKMRNDRREGFGMEEECLHMRTPSPARSSSTFSSAYSSDELSSASSSSNSHYSSFLTSVESSTQESEANVANTSLPAMGSCCFHTQLATAAATTFDAEQRSRQFRLNLEDFYPGWGAHENDESLITLGVEEARLHEYVERAFKHSRIFEILSQAANRFRISPSSFGLGLPLCHLNRCWPPIIADSDARQFFIDVEPSAKLTKFPSFHSRKKKRHCAGAERLYVSGSVNDETRSRYWQAQGPAAQARAHFVNDCRRNAFPAPQGVEDEAVLGAVRKATDVVTGENAVEKVGHREHLKESDEQLANAAESVGQPRSRNATLVAAAIATVNGVEDEAVLGAVRKATGVEDEAVLGAVRKATDVVTGENAVEKVGHREHLKESDEQLANAAESVGQPRSRNATLVAAAIATVNAPRPLCPPPASSFNRSGRFEVSKMDVLSEEIWDFHNTITQSEALLNRKLHLRDMLYCCISPVFPTAILLVLVHPKSAGLIRIAESSELLVCIVCIYDRSIPHRSTGTKQSSLKVEASLGLSLSVEPCLPLQAFPIPVPILRIRFTEPFTEITVDLNANNSVAIRNTHLLCYYSSFDWRVRPLVSVVKEWAKRRDMNDANRSTFTSYSLVLMVIHYLQCGANPAVLPSLQELYPKRFNHRTDVRTLNVSIPLEPPATGEWQFSEANTLGELLLGFLEYYAFKFDYVHDAISVRLGSKIERSFVARQRSPYNNSIAQWNCICIEEPFTLSNTAHSVHSQMVFDAIREAFVEGFEELDTNRDLNAFLNAPPIKIGASATLHGSGSHLSVLSAASSDRVGEVAYGRVPRRTRNPAQALFLLDAGISESSGHSSTVSSPCSTPSNIEEHSPVTSSESTDGDFTRPSFKDAAIASDEESYASHAHPRQERRRLTIIPPEAANACKRLQVQRSQDQDRADQFTKYDEKNSSKWTKEGSDSQIERAMQQQQQTRGRRRKNTARKIQASNCDDASRCGYDTVNATRARANKKSFALGTLSS
ncbi:Poly(A) RNA polymerase gld-2 [Toxocara canis]|uniref:Poly(A) RNA polymerase gld-2 n=1 Tax=Toxocara canis TaxID=6265 RepID=A0A0B2URB1_TOXCA|nr:Poly(A) RNA polymerase gld-2 [Toxocara canis]